MYSEHTTLSLCTQANPRGSTSFATTLVYKPKNEKVRPLAPTQNTESPFLRALLSSESSCLLPLSVVLGLGAPCCGKGAASGRTRIPNIGFKEGGDQPEAGPGWIFFFVTYPRIESTVYM